LLHGAARWGGGGREHAPALLVRIRARRLAAHAPDLRAHPRDARCRQRAPAPLPAARPPRRRRLRNRQLLGGGVPRARRWERAGGGGALPFAAEVRERGGALRRGDRSGHRKGARQLSAGVHPRRSHQRGAHPGAASARQGAAPHGNSSQRRFAMNVQSWLLWGFAGTVVLTSIMAGSQGLRPTRMNLPYILGTMFTPSRDRANLVGFIVHVLNGWIFSLLYVATFHALGRVTWWLGAGIGLVHAAFVLTAGVRMIPSLHPRMA